MAARNLVQPPCSMWDHGGTPLVTASGVRVKTTGIQVGGQKEIVMPFPQQQPRSFDRANVLAISTGQYGCYGLYRGSAWIYVGKGDIRARLLDHLNGDNTCINREQPTGFVDVVTNQADEVEKQLILELNPTCNRRVG